MGSDARATNRWREFLTDLVQAVRFYSRLPVPALPFEAEPHGLPDFRSLARVLPFAGAIIGIPPALAMVLALRLDLGPWLAAALSVATMTISTGAFHEDGLADTADGFGGATPERRLAIMKDSLIGSFGACALVIAFALRIGALATLADRLEPVQAAVVVVIAASLSRTAGLIPLTFLPAARLEGASHAVGRPGRGTFWRAAALAAGLAALLGWFAALPVSGLLLMMGFSAAGGFALTRLADRLIGGQTGDVAGAAQQTAEILGLLGLLTTVEP
jgi:adenosylcobinamide-GDP ribazoletransferase